MKNVILCADGDSKVYSVPDEVANDLQNYCLTFCTDWLYNSPNAKNTGRARVYATTKRISSSI